MDFKQLTALITVAEVGSVSRAAELLKLVQPAVTQRIRSLEQELGVTLFERTPTGMRPTDAGLIVVDHARRALNELKKARMRVRPGPIADTAVGKVVVGLLESTTDALAEPLLSVVARDYPGIDLSLMTGDSAHLQKGLDTGRLHMTMLDNVHTTPSLNIHPLITESLWVVAPPGDGLRPDRPLPFAAAAERPLVIPASGVLRGLIDEAVAQTGVDLTIAVETDSTRLQKHLALAGHGWTILPGVGIADDFAKGLLSAAPVCQPELHRSLVLGLSRAHTTSAPVQLVAGQLTQRIKAAVNQGRWYPGT
ncbi:MAG: LysR family transcriptional regulator [Streptomycetaceae bacterium]|nr:LysR family transcriptional regulator [Streptomycetaceae bacterium]